MKNTIIVLICLVISSFGYAQQGGVKVGSSYTPPKIGEALVELKFKNLKNGEQITIYSTSNLAQEPKYMGTLSIDSTFNYISCSIAEFKNDLNLTLLYSAGILMHKFKIADYKSYIAISSDNSSEIFDKDVPMFILLKNEAGAKDKLQKILANNKTNLKKLVSALGGSNDYKVIYYVRKKGN